MKRKHVDIDSSAVNFRQIKHLDNLDDRREIWRLLGHRGLDDRKRMAFIGWCCQNSGDPLVRAFTDQSDVKKYTVQQSIDDICMLNLQHGLDLNLALAELVRRVKRL